MKLDRHRTAPCSIAAAMVSASTWAATSCTRNRLAPRSNAATAAPTEAASLPTRPFGSPSRRASVLLRETPTSTGRPIAQMRVEPSDEREVLVDCLAEADPGVEAHAILGDARRRPPRRAAPRGMPRPPRRRRRSAARACIVRGVPCMCIRQTYAPASAITPASSGSPRSAVTSLTSAAPSASARRATSAFDVSIETGSPASSLEHGHDAPQLVVERDARGTRPRRLAADVDERRALVDAACRAAAAAAVGSRFSPPSEKLSGVTLTIPITAGRPNTLREADVSS